MRDYLRRILPAAAKTAAVVFLLFGAQFLISLALSRVVHGSLLDGMKRIVATMLGSLLIGLVMAAVMDWLGGRSPDAQD